MHIGPTHGHTRTDAGLLSVVECWMLSQPKCAVALWPEHKRQSQAAETQGCFQGNLFCWFLVVDSGSGRRYVKFDVGFAI